MALALIAKGVRLPNFDSLAITATLRTGHKEVLKS